MGSDEEKEKQNGDKGEAKEEARKEEDLEKGGEKEKGKKREKEKSKGKGRDRDRDRDKGKERDRHRDKDRDKDRHRDRDRRRSRRDESRSHSRHRRRHSRSRDRRSRDADRHRSRKHRKSRSRSDSRRRSRHRRGRDRYDSDGSRDSYRGSSRRRKSSRRTRSYSSSSSSSSRSRSRTPHKASSAGLASIVPSRAGVMNPLAIAALAASMPRSSASTALAVQQAMAAVNPATSAAVLASGTAKPAVDKTLLELFVGNTPQGVSEFVLVQFLNAAMKQAKLNTTEGDPIVGCRASQKFAFIELRSVEECSNALNLNGIPFMGVMLKIGRPAKYAGPHVDSKSWQELTGQPVVVSSQPDPATKIHRELYIGNTTPEMNEAALSAFLSKTMEQMGLSKQDGSCVSQVRQSTGFSFVECRTPDEATAMLNLTGIPFMGQNLRICRPAKYPGPVTPAECWDTLLAKYKAGELSTGPPGLKRTRVLRLSNMLTEEDMADDESISEIETDTKEECSKFGPVKSVHIVRPSTTAPNERPGSGFVFVEFGDVQSSAQAALSLRGRLFDGRKVEVVWWDEVKFAARDFRASGEAKEGADEGEQDPEKEKKAAEKDARKKAKKEAKRKAKEEAAAEAGADAGGAKEEAAEVSGVKGEAPGVEAADGEKGCAETGKEEETVKEKVGSEGQEAMQVDDETKEDVMKC